MNEPILSTVSKNNDDGRVVFLGEVDNLITYTTISSSFGVTEGTVNSTDQADKWLHFKIDDKELYVSKVFVRNNITWGHLYSKGLIYGTKDNGLYPTGSLTNQYKTITLNSKLYKCRLLKGCNQNQFVRAALAGAASIDHPITWDSEWNRIFYLVSTTTVPSYSGKRLNLYSDLDLLISSGSAGGRTLIQERASDSTTRRGVRGFNGISGLTDVEYNVLSTFNSWRPCLELV